MAEKGPRMVEARLSAHVGGAGMAKLVDRPVRQTGPCRGTLDRHAVGVRGVLAAGLAPRSGLALLSVGLLLRWVARRLSPSGPLGPDQRDGPGRAEQVLAGGAAQQIGCQD